MFSTLCRSKLLTGYCKQFKLPLQRTNILQNAFKPSPRESLINKKDYRTVYNFPWIVVVAGLVKYKYAFPILTAACAPFVYYFETSGKSVLLLLVVGAVQLSFIIPTVRLLHSSIGRIYVRNEGDIKEVLISSVNASGRRIDKIHPINDLFIYEATTVYELMGFAYIKTKDTLYKVNIKSGKFLDEKFCRNLFGHLPLFQSLKKKK